MRTIGILILSLLFVLGCSSDQKKEEANQAMESSGKAEQKQETKILVNTEKPTEVSDNKYTKAETGLKYVDLIEGNSEKAKAGDQVVVHYTGWLTDGKRFDSSVLRNRTFNFELGAKEVIAGWDEGVEGMKVNGVRQLYIPPELGYGQRGAGGVIPPNATLIFEVQLIDVK